jgi:homoaconitase/3-isopropylmalate dehydratase large subunit
MFLEQILEFLNKNSGAFNLLFSMIVAVATVVYARLTASLVSETKRLREVQTEPSLEVLYISYEDAMPLLEFVVKNVGQGTAYDISLQIDNESLKHDSNELIVNLQNMQIFKTGMNLLCPSQEYKSFWTDVRKDSEKKLKLPIKVISSCKSSAGIDYKKQHILDLSELEGKVKLGTHPLYKIAKSIENIEKNIAHLSSGFSKLKVETYNALDRANEQSVLESQLAEFRKISSKGD